MMGPSSTRRARCLQRYLVTGGLMVHLAACSFAPTYHQPSLPVIPQHYKETGKWMALKHPQQLQGIHQWWKLYHDPILNQLEARLTVSNQNLKVAFARYRKAVDLANIVRSKQYPSVLGIGGLSRQRSSLLTTNQLLYNTFIISAYMNYEIDVWGRVRHAVLAADKNTNASLYDLGVIDLSLHAELASDYFKLRAAEAMQQLLEKTARADEQRLYLIRQQLKWGTVFISEVEVVVKQLEEAKAVAADLKLKRAQLEHAIAMLIGEPASVFSLRPQHHWQVKPVMIASHIPSRLLASRPDLALLAERVESANASIGVARAAFFPVFSFIGLFGTASTQLNQLFSSPSLYWSVGPPTTLALITPEISGVVFDGFKLQSQLKNAKDSYYELVATYKQTALNAFQQVEDALVALRRLNEENQFKMRAMQAARTVFVQETQRYQGGIIPLQAVLIAEKQAYQAQLACIQVQAKYQLSSIQLIRALGGGWQPPPPFASNGIVR